jgi:hypothetical protein
VPFQKFRPIIAAKIDIIELLRTLEWVGPTLQIITVRIIDLGPTIEM